MICDVQDLIGCSIHVSEEVQANWVLPSRLCRAWPYAVYALLKEDKLLLL